MSTFSKKLTSDLSPRQLFKNKIDYFLTASESSASLLQEHPNLAALKEPIEALEISAMFAKTDEGLALKREFDEFLGKLRADGTLDAIYEFWGDPANLSTPIDTSSVSGQRVLRFATDGTDVPTSFMVGDKIAGVNPDLAVRFCKERGYGIEVFTVNFSGTFAGFVRSVANLSKPSRTVRKPSKPSLRRAAVRRVRSLGFRSWQAFAETLHVLRSGMRAAAALRWRTGGCAIRQRP